ncbi:O-antigen ligase family protein [Shinella oryzae]|uniref:O-antigen ligase family protein n=1 Tax=Shinella oryzae TaxID=2871820 RepID=UPI001FF4B345|nr:O-antigen ligase [Shinella oryzae]UPA23775.1 O-antigen ligase family protein [Shinella oryzae]
MATTVVIKPFEHDTSASRRSVRPILFIVMAYFWITLSPLPDMSELTSDAGWGTSSSALNQIIVLLMAGGILASLAATKAWKLVFQQRLLLTLILVWFTATALLGNDPSAGFRRMMFVVIVCFCANAFLLVPRSQADFTFTLACIVSIVVGLSYIGVIALPVRAIHQATDGLEASLAGSWRGIYSHKNITAAAMAMAVFIGLYIASTGSKRLGWALAISALLFVLFSGGKTSTIMVPFTLLVAWAFERFRKIRGLMVWGILIVANTILLGSALSPSVADTLTSLGVDATFTDRSSIWRLSIDAIQQRPLLGYGFQSFWQTQALFDSDAALETWAVTAANAHNAYVEAMVNAGLPGLILTLVWMVYSPLRNATAALKSENDIRLTRLFLRIWLFGLFLSCLESAFYVNTGPVWFTILLSVFGLGLQARSKLVKGDSPAVAGKRTRRG